MTERSEVFGAKGAFLPDLLGVRHLWVAGLAIYAGFLWYIGGDRIGGALGVLDARFVAALVVVELATLWLRAAKWRVALGSDSMALRHCFVSKAGGNLTPARIGEFSPLLFRGQDKSRLGAWIVADRLMEASATLALGVAGLFVVVGFSEGRGLMGWALAVLAVIGVTALAIARADRLVTRLPRFSENSLAGKIVGAAQGVAREFRALGPRFPVLLGMTFAATFMDLCIGLLLYAGFGVWIAFAVLAVAQCVHALTSVIPLTPNATGIPYVAAAGVLNQVAGVPMEVLAAAVGVRLLAGSAVFWGSFGAVLSMKHRGDTEGQGALFDRLASGPVLYAYAPEMLSRLNGLAPAKGRTLDLGCGDGVIGEALDGGPMFGVEISRECAKLALGRGLRCSLGDATQALPFQDDAFDTIYCVDVLHHLGQKWDAIFPELDRVLRPGGRLVIVEPDARNPFVRWTQAPESPIRVAPWHDEPAIDPAELVPHLASLGYEHECKPIQIDGSQEVRSVFPLWQRLMKAPFVIVLNWMYRNRPNKFALLATKPG